MSTEKNKEISRRFWELFDAGKIEAIEQELLDPKGVFHFPGMPAPLNVEAFRQVGVAFRTGFPDLRTMVEFQVAEGDKVVSRLVSTGTHRGEFQGIPATGKKVKIEGIVIERIVNGKIVERWDEFDAVGMMQQLGVMPMPEHT
jgi:steroid delta-isomerase-like uncharacterized protein